MSSKEYQPMCTAPKDGTSIKVKLIANHSRDIPDEIEVRYIETTHINGRGRLEKYCGWKYVDESKYIEFWYQDYSFKGWKNINSVNLNHHPFNYNYC